MTGQDDPRSRATIDDIARSLGLGRATVSRALNGRSDVRPDTRDRVRAAAARMGYAPSAAASALRTGRSQTIGLLVPSVQWPWLVDVLQGVSDAATKAGYALLLFSMTSAQTEREFIARTMPSRRMDGLLLIVPPGMVPGISALADHGLPVVVVDDRGHRPGLPSVASTNVAGARQATNHLISLGRRDIALISGPMHFGCCRERFKGYREALAGAGIPFRKELAVQSDFTTAGGAAALAHIDSEFDAVFAMNDLIAIGAMSVLGRLVPGDVSVVGFDDIAAAQLVTPHLTTVRQPLYEMGEAAVGMVIGAIEGRVQKPDMELPTRLVIRDSCGGK